MGLQENTSFLWIGLLFVLVVVVGFALLQGMKPPTFSPQIYLNSTPPLSRNTLYVSADAEMFVQPDQAKVYLSIVTDDDSPTKAQQLNSNISRAVIDALVSHGVRKEDIESESYSLIKDEYWDSDKKIYVFRGYKATHTLRVTTREITKVGELVDVAVSAGAHRVDYISFELSREQQNNIRKNVMLQAANHAKEKAEALAQAMGVKLQKPITVSENSFTYIPFEYARAPIAGYTKEGSTTISPEKVRVTSSVSVTFETT